MHEKTSGGGHPYWTNGYCICRARLNGTDVNQRFIITEPSDSLRGLFGLAVDPGQ